MRTGRMREGGRGRGKQVKREVVGWAGVPVGEVW